MSYIFGINSPEQRQQLQSLTKDWDGQNDLEPGALDGIGIGVGNGLMRGGAMVARGAAMAGAVAPIISDALTGGTDAQDWYFKHVVDDATQNAVDYWTPSAHEVGWVGNALGSLAEVAIPLMLGGGNPAALVASTQLNTGLDAVKKGVDANTAVSLGILSGGATALGAWMPFFGKTLASRVAINAGANTALGAGERAAQAATLSGAGRDDLAAQYDPFDLQAMAVDALTGGVFGAIYRGDAPDLPAAVFGENAAASIRSATEGALSSMGEMMRPSQFDHVFSAKNIKQFHIDSAPGRPIDPDSWAAHSRAMEQATQQVLRGQPVDVGDALDGAGFDAPQTDMPSALDEWLADSDDLDAPDNAGQFEPRPIEAGADVAAPEPVENGVPKSTKNIDLNTPKAPIDPDVTAIEAHIKQHGDFDVRIAAAADDGEAGITRKASELLADADQQITEAEGLGRGIMAAASCFLGVGT